MDEQIYINMKKHDTLLGKYATKDSEAIYLKEANYDIRTPFFRDIDKVIYSLSYIRYMHKTQVFSFPGNDHIQSRMLHVQYVSKIARTIGRALNLNEDLIEAASLGHDLGHTPYGHIGERILNDISHRFNAGCFLHNIHSVRNLMCIENYGIGHNISVQVLDAIMCHNGEIECEKYEPVKKSKEEFLKEYNDAYLDEKNSIKLRPMTLEGCVVRISDIIAYLGRDIEDGIRKGLLTKEDIPKEITDILGDTNSKIVNTIICDIIKNSIDKPYIKLSPEVFNAISALKKFNYEHIYSKSLNQKELEYLVKKFNTLADTYLNDLKTGNKDSIIYTSYLNNMSDEYNKLAPERIVIDYIAGMTDDYLNSQYLNIKQ